MFNSFLFTFNWANGNRCANDYIIEYLKLNNIKYHYEMQRLVAYVKGVKVCFDYKQIKDDKFGVLCYSKNKNLRGEL
jgi:hypothetical protein